MFLGTVNTRWREGQLNQGHDWQRHLAKAEGFIISVTIGRIAYLITRIRNGVNEFRKVTSQIEGFNSSTQAPWLPAAHIHRYAGE